MDKDIHKGHRSRLRQRVRAEGLEHFQDYQVLEYALSFVIPYKDTNPIAHRLINKFGSIRAVFEANEEDLAAVDGMGEVSAQFLTSIIKLYNYYEKEKTSNVKVFSPQNVYETVKGYFAGKINEELYLVSVSPNNQILKSEKVVEGTGCQASVTIRQITDMISRNKVHNVIIAHNHPKGDATPSKEDDKLTKALVTSLLLNDCFLIDHVIVGEKGSHYSYRQSRKIDEYRESVAYLLTGRELKQQEAYYEVDYD